MRIACVHIPQLSLQSLCRIDPSLRGAAVAVVGAGVAPAAGARPSLALHSPLVLACSLAAWQLGVRLGMTASAARYVSPDVRVMAADAQAEREVVRAIADALLGVSTVVDTGGRVDGGAHLAMYCAVPSKLRAATFGDRLIDILDALGLAARIGIADDRFTAWVAAAHGDSTGAASAGLERMKDARRSARSFRPAGSRTSADGARKAAGMGTAVGAADGVASSPADGAAQHEQALEDGWQRVEVSQRPAGRRKATESPRQVAADRAVVCVPRGGSAAFLAPRPLSLLAITPEVQHMLEALGVRTLGEFAALPAPSVSRPLEADYQALARGDSGSLLRPYAPDAPICEELVAGRADGLFGRASAVAALVRRVSLRLAGRARGASRLDVTIVSDGRAREVPITPARAASSERELTELIAPVCGEVPPTARLRVIVAGEAIVRASSEESTKVTGDATPDPADEATSGDGAGAAALDVDSEVDESVHAVAAALASMAPRGQLGRRGGPAQPPRADRWQLIAPQALRAEPRGPHRRTRRAKPRRRTRTLAQSLLFGNNGKTDR